MHRTTGAALAAVGSLLLCASCTTSAPAGAGRHVRPVPTAAVGAAAASTVTAELRAGLTYLLTEHVYATGRVAQAVVDKRGNLKDPLVVSSLATLQANSEGLAAALTAYTPAAREVFLQAWEQRATLFVGYAVGRGLRDDAQTVRLRAALDASRTAVANAIHGFVPELSATKVSEELSGYSASVLNAIDDELTKPTEVPRALADAAAEMPSVAALLAAGIAANKSLR